MSEKHKEGHSKSYKTARMKTLGRNSGCCDFFEKTARDFYSE